MGSSNINIVCSDNFMKDLENDVFRFFKLHRGKLLAKTRCSVYLSQLKSDESVHKVVKMFPRDEDSTARFVNEVHLMTSLQHPNVMVFEMAASFPMHNAIVMPYCQVGALYHLIGKMTQADIEHYFLQMCAAVKYLHSQGVVHRDIKLDNVLVDNNKHLFITDFDLACTVDLNLPIVRGRIGTLQYMAPEMDADPRGAYDGFKLDTYALGLVLWCMLFRKDIQDTEDFLSITRTSVWVFPLHFYRGVLESLLNPDPVHRWDIDRLIGALKEAHWLAERNAATVRVLDHVITSAVVRGFSGRYLLPRFVNLLLENLIDQDVTRLNFPFI